MKGRSAEGTGKETEKTTDYIKGRSAEESKDRLRGQKTG